MTSKAATEAAAVVWSPDPATVETTNIARFARWVAGRRGVSFGDPLDYDRAWDWSVSRPDQFWSSLAEWAGVMGPVEDARVLTSSTMPGAAWFPDATINYADQALRHAGDGQALIALTEDDRSRAWSWAELQGQVGAFAASLRRLGVESGDRVVGYLGNTAEAVIAFLSTAAVGAVWSACAPDFGAKAVLDRFSQLEPKVLVAVDGYRFGERVFDRRAVIDDVRAGLPSVLATILIEGVPADNRDTGPPLTVPAHWLGMTPSASRNRHGSPLYRSTIRCGSSTRPVRRACRKGSSTGTGGSCSNRSSCWLCTSTSARRTASCGIRQPPGSCGTSACRRCCVGPRS